MKHFLAIADLTPAELKRYLDTAKKLKAEWSRGGNQPILKNKTLGMVFQKPSLRTRVSFDLAMLHLGGHALYLSPNEIWLGQRESVADVSRVLSRYVDGILARVFAHAHVTELAKYSRVPVINGLSDQEHPCQALADVFTIVEHLGRLKGLKVAFFGDGNNVARSLMLACALGGARFVCASPHGYWLDEASVSTAREFATQSGGDVALTEDPGSAARDADVLYTDVWASMGQEEETAPRAKVFPPYQLNAALLALAKPTAIVMHCLPAHRGMEITDQVADGPQSVLFDQAENRMHAQKAILALLMGKPLKKRRSLVIK
ncbi:MAG: ornithine carbamoyltransferase [Chloroflexota bacterium]|nr:ornithine carbamoyltransferase [Chloroflexota bacterium]